MIADTREQILLRIMELMREEYVAARTLVRNRALTKQDDRPAIALLDGDETPILTGDHLGKGRGGRVGLGPQLVIMRPQLFVIMDSRKPLNEGLGSDVNAFRIMTARIIANDPVLLSILGSNGSVAYMGMETDLKSGSRLDGEIKLEFAFTYVFDPT